MANLRYLIVAVIVFGGTARADEKLNCDDSTNMNQSQMNMCWYQEFAKADAALNEIWPEVKVFAKSLDQDASEGDQTGADALLKSQRAWLVYREQQCALESFTSRGGSMQPMLNTGCKTALTNARVSELKNFISPDN